MRAQIYQPNTQVMTRTIHYRPSANGGRWVDDMIEGTVKNLYYKVQPSVLFSHLIFPSNLRIHYLLSITINTLTVAIQKTNTTIQNSCQQNLININKERRTKSAKGFLNIFKISAHKLFVVELTSGFQGKNNCINPTYLRVYDEALIKMISKAAKWSFKLSSNYYFSEKPILKKVLEPPAI